MYGKLEEPDGLAGLVRLRSGPAHFQDQLLAAEKAGSWSEALALHEQALQRDASLRPNKGALKDLLLLYWHVGPSKPHCVSFSRGGSALHVCTTISLSRLVLSGKPALDSVLCHAQVRLATPAALLFWIIILSWTCGWQHPAEMPI